MDILIFEVDKMKLKLARIITKAYNMINSKEYMERFRMNKNDFTRNRKLSFPELCLMIIKSGKRGLRVGIDEFLTESKSEIDSYSKAAFCKARKKISPEAFKELFRETVTDFYSEEKVKTFKGYRVLAIDGSDFNLPNNKEIIEFYGAQNSKGAPQAQAVCSCLYDVLNEIIVDAALEPQNFNERNAAQNHIEYFSTISSGKEILLMDRGYPSETILKLIENKGFNYIIRAEKNNFFREVRKIKSEDEIIERKISKDEVLKIRVLNIQLPNGTVETLLTNINDSCFSTEDFALLYKMRWNIETKYDELKNKFMIEDFTGISPICIQQDFYATIFLSNLLTYLKLDNQKKVNTLNKSKNKKYEMQINTSAAVYELKTNVVELFFASSKVKFYSIFRKIQKTLLETLLPVRPDRSFEHTFRFSSKFSNNNKLR